MKGKILLVVGLGIGYVLGTRAGREQYDKIKATFDQFWSDPRVQKQVDNAQEFVKDKAQDGAEFLADGAKSVVAKVAGTSKPAAKPAAAPSKPATRKPAASKSSTAK